MGRPAPEPVDVSLSSWDAVVELLLMTARGESEAVAAALAERPSG
ncbi:hypothetical protein OKJ48_16690 [Streptomyces kunmingensis]|uniref:Uncharacterized protein n=1 Tax=Streptomyces kunmingensis TaxID=68225 RepID=A0ABU6CAY9_9ACTN|nr:hypothetical protein [Streptomyces kunmingensis]MEB3961870.1 hypothetical protein [Streptomyces kunmingensis]